MSDYHFQAPLRQRSNGKAPASWYFVTLPPMIVDDIRQHLKLKPRKGWGSVPVTVRIGYIQWHTSIFPDSKSDAYLLPLKAQIRKELYLGVNDMLDIYLSIGL